MGSGNDILDMYIYETNTLLEQLENIVLESEKANYFSQDSVNEIFRIMHTIKGSSAMMEFDTLARVAHRIEDMFFIIRENTMDVVPSESRSDLFDLLFQSIDYFRNEIGKVESGQPLDKNIDTFLSNVNSLISKIQGEEGGGSDEPAASASPEAAEAASAAGGDTAAGSSENAPSFAGNKDFPHMLNVCFDEGSGMESLRSFMLVTAIRDFCAETDFIFEPANVETDASTSDYIAENGFMLMFKNEDDRNNAIPVVTSSGSVRTYQVGEYQPPKAQAADSSSASPAKSAAAAGPAADNAQAAQGGAQQHASKESLISVNLSKLDQLSAIVGEIVITESMVTSSPDLKGLNLDAFTKSARQLRKLTDELQDVSMSLRMVPVSATFQKMNRIVRDMSKKLNRPAKLTLVGENTEIDKTIVDSIGDPIMHMVRNSMDHGIEDSSDERIALGKDPVGEITLSAKDTGSEVIIEISDDGRGVDYDQVLKKAIKNGLANPDIEYSYKDVLNFLMMPGFSTNVEVTEFSGRGVGMDVVKKGVEELGGTVSISSKRGEGMTTTMKIPLTMAIMDGMEVSVGKSIFTIPINNIRQSFKVSSEDIIHDSSSGEMIKIMDNFYPIIRAKDLYQLDDGFDEVENGILLWLEAGELSYCLFVDELIGEQQVVVKQLPAYVNSYNIKDYGINGCTLLGDGSISIILDVANIYMAVLGV